MTVEGQGGGKDGEGTAEEGGTERGSVEGKVQQGKKPPDETVKLGSPRGDTSARTTLADNGDPDDQEDDEILEESPCKRWSKRREKVKQRDVPGIDFAYLAMDNETGNEVVWNEVLFSERKNFREQEEKIRAVFDNLIRLEHPNLVKFHKYWMDTMSDKPRIIFITEYMSSGSMSRFLQRARSSGSLLNIKAWKNWTRQILFALSYLHSCDPPIVHANLTCNTVFIQQNGLVKIGCVAPKTIHHHVKTFRENIKNVHYLAPEYDHQTESTIQADIYSFGVCALEMATTGALQGGCLNGSAAGTLSSSSITQHERDKGVDSVGGTLSSATTSGGSGFHMVTEEMVQKAFHSIEDPEQKEFIGRCLEKDPAKRANVSELLSRLGPPEPDKNEETSLDEDGFEQHQLEQTQIQPNMTLSNEQIATSTSSALLGSRAISPPQSSDIADVAGNGIAGQGSRQSGSSANTAVTPLTVATSNSATIAQCQNIDGSYTNYHPHHFIVSATTAANTSSFTNVNSVTTSSATIPPADAPLGPSTSSNTTGNVNATATLGPAHLLHAAPPDEGYHTNQSIVDGTTVLVGGGTGAESIGTVQPPSQHREARQIVQLHAELLEPNSEGVATKLRVQLQLDDQMNRQLTTQLKEEDSGKNLADELVQHGFVSEANSPRVCELLTEVLSKRVIRRQRRSSSADSLECYRTSATEVVGTSSAEHSSASPQHRQLSQGTLRRAS